ncbi:DUF892 family protein [Phytoactinopolyspora mesophila]|uniref:DUF892 family protein n=1 Tax=Phytoactinopolyspora mesophila TaxID=2650750 RepID=A0A7K3M6T8_9ACTN|nr:DUF892 family protein [Phytoactinopolyspora mesophila]NDL59029.1 DUF892 family protein [Phytoactinopolyspora mesophila]
MNNRERVISWLNDAYAMEQALEENLKRHADDAKDDEEVRSRIQQHIQETRHQAETVRGCIESMGGEVSRTKSVLAGMFGGMQGMANRFVEDTMLKNAIADYAAEHFEIASYKALIAACKEIGEDEVAEKLTNILHEEEEMAAFIEEKLSGAVQHAMSG